MLTIAFSRRLAVLGGFGLPVIETIRRWRDWPGPLGTWLPWADDYILGAVLLLAAWMSRPTEKPADPRTPWLTAGWGFVCGAGFGSILAQLHYVLNPALGSHEPSGLSDEVVVMIKCALLAVGIVGLCASMRPAPAMNYKQERPKPG